MDSEEPFTSVTDELIRSATPDDAESDEEVDLEDVAQNANLNARLSSSSVRTRLGLAGSENPRLYLQTPDEYRRPLAVDENSPVGGPRSAVESITDFTSIITVDDYGIQERWLQVEKEQLKNQQLSVSSPKNDRDRDLKAVGGSFAPTDQAPQAASRKSEQNSVLNNLTNELDLEREESKHGGESRESFLPLGKLFELLSRDRVERLLEEIFPGDDEPLGQMVNAVCDPKTGRLLILATLIAMKKAQSITHFIKNDVRDSHLPLRRFTEPGNKNRILFYRKCDKEDDPECQPLDCLDGHWKYFEMGDFCDYQYRFVVPFFAMAQREVVFHKIEEPKVCLPFLEWEQLTRGGYATVSKVKMHPSHHDFVDKDTSESNPYFAVKQIWSTDHQEFKDEVKALEKFCGPKRGHRHLIRLLMAIQHGDKYYLVFRLATGNLENLWQQRQMNPGSISDVRWLMEQCLGLTDGLKKIHKHLSLSPDAGLVRPDSESKNRGRHGDITPRNILFFDIPDNKPDLVITDFGLTSFHSDKSISRVAIERVGGLSSTYRPPEYDLKDTITQAYDMWSLGCLYLEFISWFLTGDRNIKAVFTQARVKDDIINPDSPQWAGDKFFNILEGVATVKKSVLDWITELKEHPQCAPCLHDFLDLIQEKLLNPEKRKRARAEACRAEIEKISKKCSDDQYCVKTKPKSTHRLSSASLTRGARISPRSMVRSRITDMHDAQRALTPAPVNDEESAVLQQKILDERDQVRAQERAVSEAGAGGIRHHHHHHRAAVSEGEAGGIRHYHHHHRAAVSEGGAGGIQHHHHHHHEAAVDEVPAEYTLASAEGEEDRQPPCGGGGGGGASVITPRTVVVQQEPRVQPSWRREATDNSLLSQLSGAGTWAAEASTARTTRDPTPESSQAAAAAAACDDDVDAPNVTIRRLRVTFDDGPSQAARAEVDGRGREKEEEKEEREEEREEEEETTDEGQTARLLLPGRGRFGADITLVTAPSLSSGKDAAGPEEQRSEEPPPVVVVDEEVSGGADVSRGTRRPAGGGGSGRRDRLRDLGGRIYKKAKIFYAERLGCDIGDAQHQGCRPGKRRRRQRQQQQQQQQIVVACEEVGK
ncbi:hypothetical protein GGR56DRAFT_427518 [Xylariaceae sp. FL0804]|nr:hypothetical protein GGR56DRAFT_427518 [Xylariaceae sp. FL0804]